MQKIKFDPLSFLNALTTKYLLTFSTISNIGIYLQLLSQFLLEELSSLVSGTMYRCAHFQDVFSTNCISIRQLQISQLHIIISPYSSVCFEYLIGLSDWSKGSCLYQWHLHNWGQFLKLIIFAYYCNLYNNFQIQTLNLTNFTNFSTVATSNCLFIKICK